MKFESIILAAALATPVPERASTYTKVSDADCTMIEENQETYDWTGSCAGVSGYSLEWSISDLRDDLEIIDGPSRTQLQIPSIVAMGKFDALGGTAEWRGPKDGRPDVLIVRVHVADDAGSLAIARLGEKPCLVAVVPPGPGQSDRTRAIADGPLPACLKE